jgi:hypothetical protein
MRLISSKYLPLFAFAFISLPGYGHADIASWEPTQITTIGNAQIQPGKYLLKTNEAYTDLEVIEGGKVIATTICYWTDLPQKAAATEVKVSNNQVTEVQFRGRSVAILFF